MPCNSLFRCAGYGIAAVLLCVAMSSGGSAQSSFPDPNTCDPAECGQASPLIPMHSTEAVHMGLVWKKNSQKPKILFHSRFPQAVPGIYLLYVVDHRVVPSLGKRVDIKKLGEISDLRTG